MTRDVLLQGINLTRRWGGLVAVNNVSISLKRGQVHGVIGTNGAGNPRSSTCFQASSHPPLVKLSCWDKTCRTGLSRVVRVQAWAVVTNATPSSPASLCSKTAASRRKRNTNKHGPFGAAPTAMPPRAAWRKMWPRVWAWATPLSVKLVF